MRTFKQSMIYALVLLLMSVGSARATVIGFDSLDASSGPVSVTNQYAGLGVTFSGLYITEGSAPYVLSHPNVGVINDETPYSLLVTAVFAGDVGSVSALFFDSNVGTNLVTMKAYDASDSLLGTTDVLTPGSQMASVGLSFAGIRKITMETDTDGSLFDDFTFTPAIAVPEPGTLALFGLSLGALALARRRKRT